MGEVGGGGGKSDISPREKAGGVGGTKTMTTEYRIL